MILFSWMRNEISLFCCQCAKINKYKRERKKNKSFGIHRQFGKGSFICVSWVDKHGLHLRNVFVSLLWLLLFFNSFPQKKPYQIYSIVSACVEFYVLVVRCAVHDGFCKPFGRVCFASAHLWWTDKCYYTVKKQLFESVCVCASARVYGIKRASTSTSNNMRLLSILILSNANSRNLRHKIETNETKQ